MKQRDGEIRSTDVANVRAPEGVAPPRPLVYVPTSEFHVEDEAVRVAGNVPGPHQLDPIDGTTTRPAKAWIDWFTGMGRWFGRFTGAHGVVGLGPEPPNMAGGQQAWPNWNPRTERLAPTVPWDEGSQVV